MKIARLVSFFLVLLLAGGVLMAVDAAAVSAAQNALVQKHGEAARPRIERGVAQTAALWRDEDGNAEAFHRFCLENFIADTRQLELAFQHLEQYNEVLAGHMNKITLDLKRQIHLDVGEILPLDFIYGQYEPSSHLSDDFFTNKIAFIVTLNFPYYSLAEKTTLGPQWGAGEWGYARQGDAYTSRVPAAVFQKIGAATTTADVYISEYNICMGRLVDKIRKTVFPADLKLISHWGIRDELKARYADPQGFAKQKMIFAVMNHIINQDIPRQVINNPAVQWDPIANRVYENDKEIRTEAEPDTRYQHLLNCFHAMRELDRYYPALPSHMKRKFEAEREIPEAQVEALFTQFISAPEVAECAKLIAKRLGRKLQPFDIWYDGFKSRGKYSEEELDKLVARKYPDFRAFEADIPNILKQIGFTAEQAAFIAPKIVVDPARGSGHAWGPQMRSEQAHLRTRVPQTGMNYKGFNIAMHELGHNVEQTLTLHKIPTYSLNGVPGTSFTEAFAFVFQARDLDVLGLKNDDPSARHLKALDTLWAAYEIMGVSLVDMKVWNWLYQHPQANAAELKAAVQTIAREVWNTYYAPVFGIRDQVILAIYSHMIDNPLYLPDYAIGHLIEFQLAGHLEGKPLGPEMERMCSVGRIIPQLWMKHAVGAEISGQPLLTAAAEALQAMGVKSNKKK